MQFLNSALNPGQKWFWPRSASSHERVLAVTYRALSAFADVEGLAAIAASPQWISGHLGTLPYGV